MGVARIQRARCEVSEGMSVGVKETSATASGGGKQNDDNCPTLAIKGEGGNSSTHEDIRIVEDNIRQKTGVFTGDREKKGGLSATYRNRELIKAINEELSVKELLEVCLNSIKLHHSSSSLVVSQDLINLVKEVIQELLEGEEAKGYVLAELSYTLNNIKKAKTQIPTIIAKENIIQAAALVFAYREKNIYPNLLDPLLGSYKGNPRSYSLALSGLEASGLLTRVERSEERFFVERRRILTAIRKTRRNNEGNERKAKWYIISREGEEKVTQYMDGLLSILPAEVRHRLSTETPLRDKIGAPHEAVSKAKEQRDKERETNDKINAIALEISQILRYKYGTKKNQVDVLREIANDAKLKQITRLEAAVRILEETKTEGKAR